MTDAGVARLHGALLAWYDAHRRPLPWRESRDPYRVWVAEVMLQQTRVDVVTRAYERFVARFPDLASLARAPEERVLAAWSGLGYYSRARNLHRAARLLRERGCATFPHDAELAASLPGVGRYTLGAVLSIAYDLPHAALDANVVRMLSRLACLARPDARGEPHASFAERLLDRARAGDWNQALMELGETVCLPRAPRCGACPLAPACEAHAHGVAASFPPPKPRRETERVRVVLNVLHDADGRVLLERGAFPYLPHLWLPLTQLGDGARGDGAHAGSFRHAILHRRLEVDVFARRLAHGELASAASAAGSNRAGAAHQRRVFSPAMLRRIGRSSLLTKSLPLAGLLVGAARKAPARHADRTRSPAASNTRTAPGSPAASTREVYFASEVAAMHFPPEHAARCRRRAAAAACDVPSSHDTR